jgi:hypothetical protein
MLRKNGQIRLTETIAVLFIFFVLILFGILFYYQYQKIAITEKQEEILASRAMETTLKTLHLPELLCSKGKAEPEDNCFDVLKLNSAGTVFTDRDDSFDYYFNLFSYSKISVYQLYPHYNNWTLYDKEKPPLEDGTPGWTKREPTYFVINLRDDTKQEIDASYGYGYVKVEAYS